MKKAAIYARFSSDKQSPTSMDDQERLCRARAAQLDLVVDRVFSDSGISGSTPVLDRPGAARCTRPRSRAGSTR